MGEQIFEGSSRSGSKTRDYGKWMDREIRGHQFSEAVLGLKELAISIIKNPKRLIPLSLPLLTVACNLGPAPTVKPEVITPTQRSTETTPSPTIAAPTENPATSTATETPIPTATETEAPLNIEFGDPVPYPVEATLDSEGGIVIPEDVIGPLREKLLANGKVIKVRPENLAAQYDWQKHYDALMNYSRSDANNFIENTLHISLNVTQPDGSVETFDAIYGLFQRPDSDVPVDLIFISAGNYHHGPDGYQRNGTVQTFTDLYTQAHNPQVDLITIRLGVALADMGKTTQTAEACAGNDDPVFCRFASNETVSNFPGAPQEFSLVTAFFDLKNPNLPAAFYDELNQRMQADYSGKVMVLDGLDFTYSPK